MPLLIVLPLLLAAGFALAWPKTNGLAARILGTIALIAGAIAPLALAWPVVGPALRWRSAATLLTYGALGLALLLGACAVVVAANGWKMLLGRRGDSLDRISLSVFDNSGRYNASLPASGDNYSVEGCLFSVVLALVGGIFFGGLVLGEVIAQYALPAGGSAVGRAARATLSLLYTLLCAGVIGLLL